MPKEKWPRFLFLICMERLLLKMKSLKVKLANYRKLSEQLGETNCSGFLRYKLLIEFYCLVDSK